VQVEPFALPLRLSALALLLALARSVSAQELPADSGAFPRGFDQVVYKGLVGNVLDAIPMDPAKRLDLQRTNAVVGSTLLGRTLTVLAGMSHPVLLLGGLAWGVWSAANIRPASAETQADGGSDQTGAAIAVQALAIAPLDRSNPESDAARNTAPEPLLLSAISAENLDAASRPRAHVVRIWLPQRAPTQLQ
jgi:hypothetical protein